MRLRLALAALIMVASSSASAAVSPMQPDPRLPTMRSLEGESTDARTAPATRTYAYRVTINGRPEKLEALINRHVAACMAAGEVQCQVSNMNMNGESAPRFSGYLNVQATPEWAQKFQVGLSADAKSIGGTLGASSIHGRDGGRDEAPTEAEIAVKTELRDQLKKQLSDSGRTEDLESLARRLANAERDLQRALERRDGSQSRGKMVEVSLSYAEPRSDDERGQLSISPKQVMSAALGAMRGSLILVLLCAIAVAPWLFAFFGIRFLWRKLRRKPQNAAAGE